MKLPEPGILHAGASGWAHSQWQGVFYPGQTRAGVHQLERYAQFFNSVEITASLYGPLKPELSGLWAKLVSAKPDFQFVARAWRNLVEARALDAADVTAFRAGLQPLADKGRLGAVLLEFPANFRYDADNRQRLIALRRALAPFPLVAEFRHDSWMREEALGTLIDFHIGFANLDQAEFTRAMPPTAFLTSPVGYVRLRGRNPLGPQSGEKREPYTYCPEQLDQWAHRIRKVNRFAKRTFVMMANDPGARSLVNAFQMRQLLGLGDGRAPKALVERFSRELAWVRPDQPLQTSLFAAQAA